MPGKAKFRGMNAAGLGIEFAAAVAGLTFLGYWIDRRFGSDPWGLLTGAALGLVGGTYNMIRDALKTARASSDPSPPSESGSAESGSAEEEANGDR